MGGERTYDWLHGDVRHQPVRKLNNIRGSALPSVGEQGDDVEDHPKATLTYEDGGEEDVLLFLKRTRDELRALRMVRVWRDRMAVFDVNGDFFEVNGLGYEHPFVVQALDSINTAYDKRRIHAPPDRPYKEFLTGRRYPWAQDRVM